MQKTPKLGLNKPDLNDYVNIADLNENMDVIDQFAQEVETQLSGVPDLETAVAELIQKVGSIQELSTANKLNLVSAINEVYQKLTAHLAEYASLTKSGHVRLSSAIDSESEGLASTPKAVKQAYDLAQSAFTSASNGKQVVGNAITGVDDSVVIPTEPTFQDLANAIGSISTGIEISPTEAGDTPILASNDLVSISTTTYVKAKAIKVNFTGTARVRFGLRRNYATVYINDIPVGIERGASSTTLYFTEDFHVSEGDEIQLYAVRDGSTSTYIDHFSINLLTNVYGEVLL